MMKIAGYREIEHTADWELQVWGPDMISLLQTAAQGMYHLSDTKIADAPREARNFEIQVVDRESLLVDFLSELLFFSEHERVAFDEITLNIQYGSLFVEVIGAPILTQAKEIKSITYHGMQVIDTRSGLRVNIVFDV